MSNIKLVHSGGNSVSLTTPDSNPTSNQTFKLPGADGSAGDFLKTDGAGNLAFQAISSVGKILKYATFTHDGYATGSYTGGAPSSTSMGYQLFSTSYTPAAANSTCVVISSSVVVSEASNFTNHFHLSLFNGDTFVSAVGGSGRYTSFNSNLNAATLNSVSYTHLTLPTTTIV